MYYDPMISKLATWGNTRGQAIDLMEKALDQYVIQGLGHNISFCRDVMRNAVFKSGIYSTKFIEEQYPDGFKGVQLSKNEVCELICIATVMHLVRSEKQLAKGDLDQYVVILGGPKGAAYSVYINVDTDLVITVEKLGDNSENAETKRISKLDWMHGQPLAKVKFAVNGDSDDVSAMSYLQDPHKYVQFEGRGDDGASHILKYNGSQQEVIVRSPYEHFLSHHMRAPEKKDFSKFLLCPMPGTLISCSVEEGQTVEAGQQLAIVEAMKMQNILRAEKQGTIKAVLSTEGSHLKVDQPIVEFM
jgi:propionyl-CoA carboxylase alpha chain